MTRRDFELIASALRTALDSARDDMEFAGVENAARTLAAKLGDVHPRFDHARFLKACGVEA